MKKSFFTFCLAFILAAGFVIYCGADIYSRRDKVTFTEKTIKGDIKATDGLTVNVSSTYANFLVWNSSVTLDNGFNTTTGYKFYPNGHNYISESNYTGVGLMNYIDYSDSLSDPSPVGIDKAYKELFDSLKPGEERSAIIKISDYYDYYPIHVEVVLPGLFFHHMAYTHIESYQGWSNNITRIQDFFKIPVLPDEELEISVSKPENSSSAQTIGLGSGNTSCESFQLFTLNAVTNEACYLTFNAKTSSGNVIDTSHIPGGFGIYRIPYTTDDKTGNALSLNTDKIEMVYSLDPKIEYIHFCTNANKNELMLYTSEKGKLYLTVFDTDMNVLQRMELLKDSGKGAFVVTEEDYTVFWSMDTEFLVLVKNENGEYVKDMYTKLSEEDFYTDANDKETYFDIQQYDSIAYKDKRLVLAQTLYDGRRWTPTCGFVLNVFDESGLIYRGEYSSSLDAGITPSNYSDRCRILNSGKTGISVGFTSV